LECNNPVDSVTQVDILLVNQQLEDLYGVSATVSALTIRERKFPAMPRTYQFSVCQEACEQPRKRQDETSTRKIA